MAEGDARGAAGQGELTRLFGLGEDGSWLGLAARAAGMAGEARGEAGGGASARLGAYEGLEEIGRGGQGTVYKARQPVTGRVVAIKRVGILSGAKAVGRFEREVEAATRLSHPNVVTVYGAEVVDGHAVITMEFVDGECVDAWAARVREQEGVGAWRTIVRAAIEICAGVGHAHQRGVIHRDIKASNVLVGRDGRARVVDFGTASVMDVERVGTVTQFAGTPQFASPEQLDGQTVDVRTDVYSLGLLVLEMLTGERAFGKTGSLSSLVDAVRRGVDARVSKRVRGVPGDLDWVLVKATATEPGGRYATMEAFGRDLRAVVEGGAVEAHPPSVWYAGRKTLRRHWVAVSIWGVVVAALGVTSAVLWVSSGRVSRALADTRGALDRERTALEMATRERDIQTGLTEMLLEIPRAANPSSQQHRPGITLVEAIDYAARERLQADYKVLPEVEAAFCRALGDIYQGMGRSDRAIEYLTRSIDRYTQVYGPTTPRILDPMLKVSRVMRDEGDYAGAMAMQERIVALRRAEDTETDGVHVAQALNALGVTQRRAGMLGEAERSLLEAKALYLAALPPGNESVGLVDAALSTVYLEMGRHEEAIAIAREAVATFEAIHRDRLHVDCAGTRRTLADALCAAGELEEAESLLREAVTIFAAIPDAPPGDVARARVSFANLLVRTGRSAEAVELLTPTVEALEGQYAGTHPRVVEAREALERARAGGP